MTNVLKLNVLLLRVDGEVELLVRRFEKSLSRVESSRKVEEENTESTRNQHDLFGAERVKLTLWGIVPDCSEEWRRR